MKRVIVLDCAKVERVAKLRGNKGGVVPFIEGKRGERVVICIGIGSRRWRENESGEGRAWVSSIEWERVTKVERKRGGVPFA